MTSDTNSFLKHLNLIDLLSERQRMLRKMSEKAWNDQNDVQISNSEWYIMARMYKQNPTISYVTKNVDISRQAIHKLIKNLSAKSLIDVQPLENNKKEKRITLTDFGEQCYEENMALKARLEDDIAGKIGRDQVGILKDILQLDWDI